jgi:hypothetical protein
MTKTRAAIVAFPLMAVALLCLIFLGISRAFGVLLRLSCAAGSWLMGSPEITPESHQLLGIPSTHRIGVASAWE